MVISSSGDIEEEDDVKPFSDTTVGIISEIVEARGSVHAYLPNHRDQGETADDIHIDADNSYIWRNKRSGDGLIFVQDGGEEHWIFPEKILYLEKHY